MLPVGKCESMIIIHKINIGFISFYLIVHSHLIYVFGECLNYDMNCHNHVFNLIIHQTVMCSHTNYEKENKIYSYLIHMRLGKKKNIDNNIVH